MFESTAILRIIMDKRMVRPRADMQTKAGQQPEARQNASPVPRSRPAPPSGYD
ncbi:hypothetical protein Geu3261_0010_040 [Komagataeibacter europaeus NBRC 3261]|uniref:Uncharacterized protein n=1 Tax=Komagataeibacter europaeus NBRC 3261 TaxID=1234669 RepID=A0A0D6PV91_KOMEU|nr:hypothetical protein Geu3261_0010_040 [Komagataeibacter europaeus NBRC 3261]